MKKHDPWVSGPLHPGLLWDAESHTLYVDLAELQEALVSGAKGVTPMCDTGSLLTAAIWTCRRMLGTEIRYVEVTGGDWS